MQNLIVGLGEILWDMFPSGKVIGGAPANFAYHVRELGESSVVVSSVGNDELGREIISGLENNDMSTDFLYITDGITNTSDLSNKAFFNS